MNRLDLRNVKVRSTRSKLCCAKCGGPAVRRTAVTRPTATLKLDASIERDTETISTFWCMKHQPRP